MKTFQIIISGQVQGVGFRPFVFKLAKQFDLRGSVCNNSHGVLIQINAFKEKADLFLKSILENAPNISDIQSYKILEIGHQNYFDFKIIPSKANHQINIPLTPDFAICTFCQTEIKDVSNRRFNYPFTTCTNCGPRFSVTTKFPFEREHTTVTKFIQCSNCNEEYSNPDNRRFHSQTNSCNDCGIPLKLNDANGRQLEIEQNQIVKKVTEYIKNGSILAIKNTNGYLLCCDAGNRDTIRRLRDKKRRPAKPFALLYPSMNRIKMDFKVSVPEEKALTSPTAPIVILCPKNENKALETDQIAPNLKQLGVMLPSSALLALLMDELKTPIIATSGNIHGSPIISKENDATKKLSGVAGYFLHHDLEISFPQDDSVSRFVKGYQIILRRSRGLAPNILGQNYLGSEKILALGAHLKSTFTLVPNSNIYVSPYFGNLDNYDVTERFEEIIGQFNGLFQIRPEVLLIDKHPQYQSSILGKELAKKWDAKLETIQHHKAHFASVLGEHNWFGSKEKVLGVIWDGTGFGDDGAIWGGEFFSYQDFEINRHSHFEYVDWIAGDKMAKEPRLSLLSMLPDSKRDIIKSKFSNTEWKVYHRMLQNNNLKTSSVGRLFDAVASLLDLTDSTTYEGEAAMVLEDKARAYEEGGEINLLKGVDYENVPTKIILDSIQEHKQNGAKIGLLARSFIYTLALVILDKANRAGYRKIACSGGVFQNAILVEVLLKLAEKAQIELKLNCILSSNDENISFGQLCYYRYIKN